MVLTIYEGYDKSYIMIGSKNPDFAKKWGSSNIKIYCSDIYKELQKISAWCNSDLGEECLFEMD